MKGRREKGQYGYRDHRRKIETAKVIFGGAAILAQLLARNFTDNEAAKNILTVMAILSVLPAANAASPLLASWNLRTPSRGFYDRAQSFGDRGILLYDLILTSKEQIMPMDAVLVHPLGVFAYCTGKKVDVKKAEAFLEETFRQRGLGGKSRIIKDEEAFFKTRKSQAPAAVAQKEEDQARALKAVSM